MKIGIYSTTVFPSTPYIDGYAGLEYVTGLLAKYLDDMGHQVHHFAPLGSYQPKHGFIYAAGEPGKIDEVTAFKMYMDNPQSKQALLDVDILHDHSWNYMPYALYNERNGRICKTHHGCDPGFRVKPPFPHPNFIGVSHNHAKNLSMMSGVTWRGVQNGIDLSQYPFVKDKEDYLLWISRIFANKGCHRFIDICDKLQMKGHVMGGSFGQDPEYVNLIKKKLENSKYVTVIGNLGESVPFAKKLEMYQKARAVVIPCVEQIGNAQFIEPFGLIVPEANSCGTTTIVSPSGGWNETTVHGLNGFFATDDDSFMYYIKRIDEIKPDDCRKHAEHFSYQRMGDEYLKLYKFVLDGGRW